MNWTDEANVSKKLRRQRYILCFVIIFLLAYIVALMIDQSRMNIQIEKLKGQVVSRELDKEEALVNDTT